MPKFTPQQLDELYHQTLAEFAASPEKWTSFLDTAARLYKYDFKSQVLIWSQRPMQQPVPSCRFGMIVCTAASIVAQTASVSLIIAAISRVSSICSIFRILRRVTSLSHRRISGRCGTMHTIQFWTVSLPHWARISRPILISLLTCICPPSALQIRKPVNTLTTPI